MFTASRKDLAELLTLFRIVEDMAVAEGTVEGTPGEMIPVEAVMREEDKVMRCYRREADNILIENDADDEVIRVDVSEWAHTREAIFEALRQKDDENIVLVDDPEEAFLDKIKMFQIAGTAEGQQHLLLATPSGVMPSVVWSRAGAFPTKILDGGRAANLKLEQTGTRFATPMAAKVNGLETDNSVRDRMLLIEDMGSSLRYEGVADKVFRANLGMLDLHLGRLLSEMVRLSYSYMEDIFKLDELTERMRELNPLKVKTELIVKHGYYEYKVKQLLLACAAGMRPAKIYHGCEDLPPYLVVVNPNGQPMAFSSAQRMLLADFLFRTARLERGSMEKDKYGFMERENNVYYFKLNLKIGLAKR